MNMIKLRLGKDIPISGKAPINKIIEQKSSKIGVVCVDFIGLKPRLSVKVGSCVNIGDTLFVDKNNPKVNFTSPAAGEIVEINRGEKRKLQSIVIKTDDQESVVQFHNHTAESCTDLDKEEISSQMHKSGMWTTLRTRPYGEIPEADSTPDAIFINTMDTNPLGLDNSYVIGLGDNLEMFKLGLSILSKLTDGNLYVCKHPKMSLDIKSDKIITTSFKGPHPAGLVSTHIHHLYPISRERIVWHLDMQDTIALGKFFSTGILSTERIFALVGPEVKEPTYIKSRIGCNIPEAVDKKLTEDKKHRVIAGNVLSGRQIDDKNCYSGMYDRAISVIEENKDRKFLGWMDLGLNRYSVLGIYLSSLIKPKKFSFTSNTNGSDRAMLPLGQFEDLMPMDILPTQLLRSIVVGDAEEAELLGALELVEEDLSLCAFVCPGKYEYGDILRDVLIKIKTEG
jgi:Na+-transporting NADH:ubiquinone oxidoreductase subunit A